MGLTIRLMNGQEVVAEIEEGQTLSIGRKGENDVSLKRSSVSRFHARIERRGDDVYLTDLDSTFGTEIEEGEELEAYEEVRVDLGSVIVFGQSARLWLYAGVSADTGQPVFQG